MLHLAAEMQKILLLAYYCKVDVDSYIFNDEETIKASISAKFLSI